MQSLDDLLKRRAPRLLAVLVAAAALAACGPGTGGTGTGPAPGAAYYVGMVSGALVPVPPTLTLPCGDSCSGQVQLTLDMQRVELGLPCQRFVHEGHWAFDAEGRAELTGRWHTLVQVGDQTAMRQQSVRLLLQLEGPATPQDLGEDELSFTVVDLAGQTLLGPVLLQRQAQTGAAISCLLSSLYK